METTKKNYFNNIKKNIKKYAEEWYQPNNKFMINYVHHNNENEVEPNLKIPTITDGAILII